MHHRHALAIAGSALAGLFIAGCGAFAPDESASAADSPSEPVPTVESEDHATGLEHVTDNDKGTAPTPGQTEFPANSEGQQGPSAADGPPGPQLADSVCTDETALAANADHEPAGWPAGHQEGEPLPDPECHPDFIELANWEHYYADCMHPLAHGHAPGSDSREPGENPRADQRRWAFEWEASELRSWWTPPAADQDCFGHDGLPD